MDSNCTKAIFSTLLLLGLLSGTAFAAEPSAWVGAYLGVHGGQGQVDNTHISQSASSSGAFNMKGSIAGAQLGYNWAAGNAVLGLEAKGSSADVDGSVTCVGGLVGRCGVKLDRLYTLQANVGISVDSLLVYVFLGAASGQIEVRNELSNAVYATSDRHTGILGGVGGVLAFSDKLNGLVEIQYTDFGTNEYVVNKVNVGIQTHMTSLIAGINYRF